MAQRQDAITTFLGRPLPEPGRPAGYARLIERYHLGVPLPPRLAAVSVRYRKSETESWLLIGSRTEVSDTLGGHLTFALKWEGVDLGVLAALFGVLDPRQLAQFVREQPTSAYGRRVWFLYEWITGERLDVPDLDKATSVDAVDAELQFCLEGGELSPRHRVRDNLPGTRAFCPLVRRTRSLRRPDHESLATQTRDVLARTHPDVVRRAGAFLLLSDSKASFEIEGERPSADRLQRWGHAIGDAGRTALTLDELLRLQRLVIGDARFVRLGLRQAGGFVGLHDRQSRTPIPEHISARPDDLEQLVEGVIEFVHRATHGGVDPIVVAAAAAFGFVYAHPFEDANGRLHRWLIHHALAVGGLAPADIVFPVSSVMLGNVSRYRAVLESYSRSLLPLIEWEETPEHNVRVLNRTVNFYRYFDATPHAEYLHDCVQETIRVDLPAEVQWLEAFDVFAARVQDVADMPARLVDLLARFLEQNGGSLSNRATTREFAHLTPEEVLRIEEAYAGTLGAIDRPS